MERLRRAAGAAGRDPSTLSVTVFNAPADAAALAPYSDAGITRVLIEVPDRGRDEVLRLLDEKASLCRVGAIAGHDADGRDAAGGPVLYGTTPHGRRHAIAFRGNSAMA